MMQTKLPTGQEALLHKSRCMVNTCVTHFTCHDHIGYLVLPNPGDNTQQVSCVLIMYAQVHATIGHVLLCNT